MILRWFRGAVAWLLRPFGARRDRAGVQRLLDRVSELERLLVAVKAVPQVPPVQHAKPVPFPATHAAFSAATYELASKCSVVSRDTLGKVDFETPEGAIAVTPFLDGSNEVKVAWKDPQWYAAPLVESKAVPEQKVTPP